MESASNHLLASALYGNKPGLQNFELVGYSGAITTTYRTVMPENALYAFRTAAMTTPYVASSDANDTSAGTGARTVSVSGINTSYASFTETVTMNGQTSVNLATTSVLAINSVTVLTAGSGAVNAGVIRVGTGVNTAGVPAVVEAHVPIGFNYSTGLLYTVPEGYSIILDTLSVSSAETTAANYYNYALDIKNESNLTYRRFLTYKEAGGGNPASLPLRIKIGEKTRFMVVALAPTATAVCGGKISGLLLKNSWVSTSQGIF